MISSESDVTKFQDHWDHVNEYEIDNSWRNFLTPEYEAYREQFGKAQKRTFDGDFPISLEVEATYYCNLKCPYCPRVAGEGERDNGHMDMDMFDKVIAESKAKGLKAILLDHEAESLMNPRFFEMLDKCKEAGFLDIWLHTNANMMNSVMSEKLIDGGITKINFSIDAADKDTYDKLRVGGKYHKVIKNVKDFLRLKKEKGAENIRTRVSFVVQKDNVHERKAFYDFWKDEPGLNLITFQDCMDFGMFDVPDEDYELSEAELEIKYKDAEPFHCSQPWEMPIVEVTGNIIPCGSPVREHTNDFVLGNLNKGDTLESCWKSKKMKDLRELHNKSEWYKNNMCRVCVKSIRESTYTPEAKVADEIES